MESSFRCMSHQKLGKAIEIQFIVSVVVTNDLMYVRI
jgi:hypothetical protein